jgi:tRNA-specific 2-thiouridylase
MSGGVDSSVAAALLVEQGQAVVGATMKLWGEPTGSGCCSVADVEDARRVAQQLGIAHHVFNFTAEFEHHVVSAYAGGHARGWSPNPCLACNRHMKFGRFLQRAQQLGFDAIATGHHARVTCTYGPGNASAGDGPAPVWQLRRGRDEAKDQSYVLYMLGQDKLSCLLLPVGELTKEEVRRTAAAAGLRTAAKPDSQDVCFISKSAGREGFLSGRIALRPGRLVTSGGQEVGSVEALELVTVGQRRGLGLGAPPSRPERRYVLDVDVGARTATVGSLEELLVGRVEVEEMCWPAGPLPPGTAVLAQMSAHGRAVEGHWEGGSRAGAVVLSGPVRRVAPGQAVVLYQPGGEGGDIVVGGGTAGTPVGGAVCGTAGSGTAGSGTVGSGTVGCGTG